MKKTFAFLLGLAVLASCSKEETGNNDNGAPVPIELGAGVNVVSRAVINPGNEVKAGIAGWETAATPTYTEAPIWGGNGKETTITTPANTTAQQVTWSVQRYYNSSDDIKTYLKAWYPAGTISADNKVTFENAPNEAGRYSGDVDVLLADVLSGSKESIISGSLNFQHMTSQIKFMVQKGEGLAEGTAIKSITIKNAQLPIGFDLTKGINEDDAVTYAEADDLNIFGITETNITDKAQSAGNPVMIRPMNSQTFKVDIQTTCNGVTTTYSDKEVIINSSPMTAGTAYEITLTFGQTGIKLTATVAEWKTAFGSAEIQ